VKAAAHRSLLLGAVAVAVLAVPRVGPDRAPAAQRSATPSLADATRLAKTRVTRRFHISGLHSLTSVRSKRNARFALVSGHYRRPARRPDAWVVYLRVTDQRWRIIYAAVGFRAFEPKVAVPCDIWPPLAEPSC